MNRISLLRHGRKLLFFLALALVLNWQPDVSSAHVDQLADRTKNANAAKIDDSPVFGEFDAWVREFSGHEFSAGFIEKGAEIAARRKSVFKELIENDPQTALRLAVNEEIRRRLPVSITEYLEKRISFKGDFLIRVEDETGLSGGAFTGSRIVREVAFEGAKYKAFVYGRKSSMTVKYDVPLGGVALDDMVALDENSVDEIEPAEYAARGVDGARLGPDGAAAEVGGEIVYFSSRRELEKFITKTNTWEEKIAPRRASGDAANLSPWTEGAKTVLFIRVDFAERPGEPTDQNGAPLTEARAQNVVSSAVNPFYVSNSYNKTSLTAVVTPVVRMPQPQSFYTGANSDFIFTHAREAARQAGFETNNYDLDVIAFGFSNIFGYAGFARIGDKGVVLNGAFDFKTIAHELGHSYGLLHANSWRTTDGTVIGNGANVEYGDAFDVMGGGGSQITHFNAGYKRSLDWLTEANVQTVTNGGVYRVYAFDVVSAPQGVHALKIKKDGAKNYWIEFRQSFTSTPSLMDGALVRWDYGVPQVDNRRQTQVLDMTPSTQSLADATLLVGQTFTDAAAGLTITVLRKGGTVPESLDVKVDFNFTQLRGAPFDFDGDNKSDIGVFRPSNGVWYLNNSSQGYAAANWGVATDKLVPAKYNSDRLTDLAVYRNGLWYVYNSFGGSAVIVNFGTADDIPIPADYDGDGLAEMAVYRPSNGTWHMWNWVFSRYTVVQFGASEDVPVTGDYDGDGVADIAIYRPSVGEWWIRRSRDASVYAFQFGTSTDQPVVGDFTGDGRADPAFWRPSTGEWFILRSEDSSYYSVPFGSSGDRPVPADYDGDGRFDTAVFRPSGATWYINRSTAGLSIQQFGLATDTPVPAAFLP